LGLCLQTQTLSHGKIGSQAYSLRQIKEVLYLVSGGELSEESGLVNRRPFRETHSSASMAAMVGGGKNAKPGEVTLAHRGVLLWMNYQNFREMF
ncbi:MAG: ATP-binding protein, partial [Candidatus Midichloria sp.]|nr:ATP-binding protein [Candidatus Midichloria sp.]